MQQTAVPCFKKKDSKRGMHNVTHAHAEEKRSGSKSFIWRRHYHCDQSYHVMCLGRSWSVGRANLHNCRGATHTRKFTKQAECGSMQQWEAWLSRMPYFTFRCACSIAQRTIWSFLMGPYLTLQMLSDHAQSLTRKAKTWNQAASRMKARDKVSTQHFCSTKLKHLKTSPHMDWGTQKIPCP